jgi:hypothetical protein
MKTKLPLISPPALKTSDIMRLDRELVWDLDHKKKSYTERTFAEMRAMMDSLGREMQGMAKESKKEKQDYEVSPPQFQIQKTGNKQTIAGYACEEVLLDIITKFKDKKTGDTGSFVLHDRLWLTKDWAGQAEYEAFSRKAAEKMGFGRGMESASSYLGMMGLDAETMAEKMKEIGGFPMKQEMTMSTAAAGAPEGRQDKAKAEEADEEESKAASDKLSKLGGLFGKKSKDKKKDEPEEAAPPPGAMFMMTIEVESVSTGGVDAAQFEIPAGYKKAEKKD